MTFRLLDVFTSLGVLITVQGLEKSVRELLSSDGDMDIVTGGVEFLRSASSHSFLASRYLTLLPRHDLHPLQGNGIRAGDAQQNKPDGLGSNSHVPDLDEGALGYQAPPQLDPGLAVPDPMVPGVGENYDFGQFDPSYSWDMLFGTGLQQELLLTDWSAYDAMI